MNGSALGLGLGVSANWPEGVAVADVLLAPECRIVDFVEIYPGTCAFPDEARAAVHRWKAQGVPMTLHTAGLDLWNIAHPDDRGIPYTCELEALVEPVWCTQDLMLTRCGGARAGVLLGAILTADAADAAAERHAACSARLRTPLLLENAPYQLLVGDMTLGAFFARVVSRCDCGLTLDIGHAVGSALVQECLPMALLEDYPFERVVEVHVAGGRLEDSPERYVDDHDAPLLDQTLNLLARILPLCTNLRAITYEVQAPVVEELVGRLSSVRDVLEDAILPATWRKATG